MEKELEALRLDFTGVAQKCNELNSRAEKWLAKKKALFRKGVMVAFLKAYNEMKKQVKAGKTN